MSIPEPAKHFIHIPFKVPYSKVTHAMDVEVRDLQCNRIEMTILFGDEQESLLMKDIDAVMEWSIRACSEPYPFTLA